MISIPQFRRSGIVLFSTAMILAIVSRGADSGWQPLFNGKNLDGWEMFMTNPDPSWDVPGLKRDAAGKYLQPIGKNRDPLHNFNVETVDGEPAIHVRGQGFGVITTRASFHNFHVRLQVKWGELKWGSKRQSPRDAGLLYFVHSEPGFDHATWPRSIEFQIQEHDMGDLYALGAQITVNARQEGRLWRYDPQGSPTVFLQKPPVGNRCVKQGDPEKPKGEWNTLDLYCYEDRSVHVVNGEVVMRLTNARRLDQGSPAPLTEGRISLQTEGAEVYYRRVMIEPITGFPAELAAEAASASR
jgi:hypothetical protein